MNTKNDTILIPNDLLKKVDECCKDRKEWITDAIKQKLNKINHDA